MDILEKIDLFLAEAIKPADMSDTTITPTSNTSWTYYCEFSWKDRLFIFQADKIKDTWEVHFEDDDGNTTVLDNFGAATHSLWCTILQCLKNFIEVKNPEAFYFKGGSNSHDLLYDSKRAKTIIQSNFKYTAMETHLDNHKELIWEYRRNGTIKS